MKWWVRSLWAIAASALLLGLLFTLFKPSAGQPQLVDVLLAAVPLWVAAYVTCALLQTALRAARYRVLLRASGEPSVPSFFHLGLVSLARNMLVDLLPGRLGELSYLALLNRGYRVSAAACISSMTISFAFDLLALALILAGLAVAAFARWIPVMVGALILLLGAAYVGLFHILPRLSRINHLARFVARISEAFDQTRRAGVWGRTMLLSIGVRTLKYAGFYSMFLAMTQVALPALAATAPGKVLITLISAEGAASLPIPTVMSFGAYEAGGAAAWSALGAKASDAALCLLAVHIGSQVVDYTLGGIGLLLMLFFSRGSSPRERRIGLAVSAAVALFVVAGLAAVEKRAVAKRGATSAPPAGEAIKPTVAWPEMSLPSGFIVWSSNRSGQHDIWKMSLPDGALSRVTRDAHAETYPRISPDGRRLLFARSQLPWASQRNERGWNVIMLDMKSGAERMLATNAFAATWLDDREVVFQVDSTNVVRMNLESGETVRIAQSGTGEIPAGVALQTPSYNARDGVLAATFRGTARMTALVDRFGAVRKVAGGCQLFWGPGDQYLYYVDSGGRMGNAFYRVQPGTLERTMFFDAPGDWSHEYFPKLSSDGRWLVYGAAAKGHEHDTADYEIFIWQVGEPFGRAMRLTWHTGNDNWPDIWLNAAR